LWPLIWKIKNNYFIIFIKKTGLLNKRKNAGK